MKATALARSPVEPVRLRLVEWDEGLSAKQMDNALDAMFGPVLYRVLIRWVRVGEIVDRALEGLERLR
jgi:hypothetical protein